MEAELGRRDFAKLTAAAAGATVAAWVVPEITHAQWAGGETLSSGPGALNGPVPPNAAPVPTQTPQHSANPLAFTGLNIQSMVEEGGVLIVGGWAMHHWASRKLPKPVIEDE